MKESVIISQKNMLPLDLLLADSALAKLVPCKKREKLTVVELIEIAQQNGLHLMLIPDKKFDSASYMNQKGFIKEDQPDLSAFGDLFDGLDD